MKDLLRQAIEMAVKRYPAVLPHLSADVLDVIEYKRLERDPQEPGREQKKRTERKLKRAMSARLKRQYDHVVASIPKQPTATQISLPFPDDNQDMDTFVKIFYEGLVDGGVIAEEGIGFALADGSFNKYALHYAMEYTTKWILGLDEVSRKILQEALQTFITRPGTSVGDIVDAIRDVFGEDRAWRIATTETTRIYAEANQIYARELAEQFPDFQVMKRYYTNNDDRVCPICGPLNGVEAPYNDEFAIPNPPLHVNCRCWTSVTVKA